MGISLGLNEADMKQVFEDIDVNGDGKLELHEFIDQLQHLDINNKVHSVIIDKLNNIDKLKLLMREKIKEKIETEKKLKQKSKIEKVDLESKNYYSNLINAAKTILTVNNQILNSTLTNQFLKE